MAVPVRADRAPFEVGEPSVLFELNPEEYRDLQFWSSLAALPDGRSSAFVKTPRRDTSARSYLMLMLDWRRQR